MGFLKATILVTLVAVVIACFPSLLRKRLPNKGAGFAAPGWRKVADTFRTHLETGVERGAGLAVYYQGELVVEFSGGYADEEAEWTWETTTLTHLFSTGKGVAAVVMAVLVDRGLLDYERPVSAYWPEFGQNGKDFITVEQLLSHQAGLAAIDEEFSAYDILQNPEKVGEILAKQKPNWKLGEGHGYHGITLGLYEDQLVRRVDPLHRDLGQFFMEEIAIPFGLDIFFGLPTEEFHRCARSYPFSVYSVEILFAKRYWEVILAALGDPTSLTWRSMSNPPEYVRDGLSNHPHFKMVNNPATHGYATAVSLGKFMGILAAGGKHEGKVLLSDKAIAALTEPLVEGKDKVLLMNITYGRGVTLRRTPMGGFMFGTPGAGGQMGYCDIGNKLGWAYLTNHQSIFAIGDDPRYLAIENAIYDTIKDLQNKQARS